MVKVITYGTYDLLHYGHIRLLQRAKELGDYLIVGITADDYDKSRGKINVQQSLMERIDAVKATGLADEIIVEEYEGQKIDDIRRLGVDIFTVGSDWVGQFDYLNEYCRVVYLERTEGVSSSKIRTEKQEIRLGVIGRSSMRDKYLKESAYVNGLKIVGLCTRDTDKPSAVWKDISLITDDYEKLLANVDAVYVVSHPSKHYRHVKMALERGVHVLCESPVALTVAECKELFALAKKQGCVLMDGIKTAYATAFDRLLLLVKSGKIGDVVSVDATCTSLSDLADSNDYTQKWNSICAWGTRALLPVFQILGTDYKRIDICSKMATGVEKFDLFSKIDLQYPNAVATIKVGKGVKAEGQLIISGTQGYVFVPAPWWKTDYFEIRYENQNDNKRYFYPLDGEGIRQELVYFLHLIRGDADYAYISENVSFATAKVMESFYNGNVTKI